MSDILKPETFARLQKHAVPLIDTLDTVINRALDALEGSAPREISGNEIKIYNGTNHPDLTFTSLKAGKVDQKNLPRAKLYWNYVLQEVILCCHKKGASIDKIIDSIGINCSHGRKEDNGYRFLSELGFSVQGQNSNDAWRAVSNLAAAFDVLAEVHITWQENERAALPGSSAILRTS